MSNNLKIFSTILVGIFIYTCDKDSTSSKDDQTITDIDGNVYTTVVIGDQEWMAENLKVTHYRNGDAIPNVTDNTEWANLNTGAYCYYDNDENNGDTYGALYNFYAVEDSRYIAPVGWHVPTDEEWKQLEMYLGMSQSEVDQTGLRGTDECVKLKSSSGWDGTNESGFTALPGGYRTSNGYYNIWLSAHFWSSSVYYSYGAWSRILSYDISDVARLYFGQNRGFSVRCIKD